MSPSKVPDEVSFTTFHNIVAGSKRGGGDAKSAGSSEKEQVHHGVDPTTGEELWPVPVATEQDVEDAVASAKEAFPKWKKVSYEERKGYLKRFTELWSEYADEMIELLCKETGKPKVFASGEVKGVVGFVLQTCSIDLPEDELEDDEKVMYTKFSPLGIVGAICPWNFPLILSVGKIAPAVLAGNVIIVKPSPFTPYTTLKAVEIAQQIFPPGVVQVVGGSDKLGAMLTAHPDIAKISFTGSIATGKKIMAACANTLKRVTLELGGNDAAIILPDVDIEKVAPEVAMGAFQNSGQVCVATKRIFVHADIYDAFLAKLVEATQKLKVGLSYDEGVILGPVQNKMQYEKVKTIFADSKEKGYKFAFGSPEVKKSEHGGYFIQPSIIDNPPTDSRIIQEEPFGPIVPCQPWTSEEEVIARANATNTGLGACVYGSDVEHAQRIGWQLEAGSVFINSYEKPTPQAYFGGHKESGLGGEWGKMGILSYCNAHVMHVYKSKM